MFQGSQTVILTGALPSLFRIAVQWLPGNVYCPGSLAEAAARCTAAQYDTSSPYSTPQARCFARPGCMWLNPPPVSDGGDMGSSSSSSTEGGPLTLADRPAALLISSILEPVYKMQQFNMDLSECSSSQQCGDGRVCGTCDAPACSQCPTPTGIGRQQLTTVVGVTCAAAAIT